MQAKALATAAILLCILAGAPLQGETAVPVKVAFALESDSLRLAWGEERVAQIETALAERWEAKLSERYRHWDFHAGEQDSYARVTLKVVEPESRKVRIAMVAERADGELLEELWSKTWLEPVDFDLGRRPAGSRAEEAVREKSEALFGKPESERLMGWLLDTVPLGKGGRWKSASDPTELRVITSLPWSRFETLKSSVFRVYCRDNDQQVPVEGEGVLDPLPFETPSGTRYEALVLKPRKIGDTPPEQAQPSEVDDFEVQIIFLEEERPLDTDFFF